jgi:hypothetical protein
VSLPTARVVPYILYGQGEADQAAPHVERREVVQVRRIDAGVVRRLLVERVDHGAGDLEVLRDLVAAVQVEGVVVGVLVGYTPVWNSGFCG